jgi:hypothetical protein
VVKRKQYFKLIFLSLAALVLTSVAFLGRRPMDVCEEQELSHRPLLEPVDDPPPSPRPKRKPAARFAVAAGFTVLFFAGASFTAGAGDEFANMLEEDVAASLATTETAPETAPEGEPTAEPAPAPEPAPEAAPTSKPAPELAPEAAPAEPVPSETAPELSAAGSTHEASLPEATTSTIASTPAAIPAASSPDPVQSATPEAASAPAPTPDAEPSPAAETAAPARPTSSRKWVTKRAQAAPAVEPEHDHGHENGATVWLDRALPDPTPASARLTREFARSLGAAARRNGTSWTIVLGTLRAQGQLGSDPATPGELDRLSARLRGDGWRGALALSGRTSFADRAQAFADYYEVVGLEALVTGLERAKPRLVARLLADDRVTIYGGGRHDLQAGRIDVRVVVLLSYLAERHDSLTVSSLFSGHRTYSRPGVVSAHTYGHAVDIAAVGGFSIVGNQAPGGITEAAVRSVLLLPSELQPRQVISLLGLGGPSFPMADHGDHIHVGY